MLHLAFDAKRLFNNHSGLGNYSRTLVRSLAEHYPKNQYHLYSPKIKAQSYNKHFQESPSFPIHTAGNVPGTWWRSYGIKKVLQENNINLYHGLSNEIPLGLAGSGIKSVVTIHDLIIKTWPQTFKTIDRAIYDRKFRYACKHADHIVAISESTKRDIIKYYGSPESKISVIYQDCGEQFKTVLSQKTIKEVQIQHKLPSEYLLYVGSIIERKNLLHLLKAILLLPKTIQIPLVVIGQGKGSYFREVQYFIEKHSLQKRVFFPKDVTNKQLPAIYQGSNLFCYPSVYEGFGIPILEALHSQVPVLTSALSSLPEAAGPQAFYTSPHDIEEMSSQIELALTDDLQRKKSIASGLLHTNKFDSEILTKQMMTLYHNVLETK